MVSQDSCEPSWSGTVCTTVHATTNMDGNAVRQLRPPTEQQERVLTFSWGGGYTSTSKIHLAAVQKNGETQTTSERSTETTSYRSGTYALDCVGSLSAHYANGFDTVHGLLVRLHHPVTLVVWASPRR